MNWQIIFQEVQEVFCVSILFVDDDDDEDGDRWVFSHDLHSHSFPLAFSKISAPVQQCLNQQSRQHTVYSVQVTSLQWAWLNFYRQVNWTEPNWAQEPSKLSGEVVGADSFLSFSCYNIQKRSSHISDHYIFDLNILCAPTTYITQWF